MSRCKVIKDFPFSPYAIGQTLMYEEKTNYIFYSGSAKCSALDITKYSEYFEKLEDPMTIEEIFERVKGCYRAGKQNSTSICRLLNDIKRRNNL